MELSSTALRLVAIFSADVFGYSRLMGADQEGTFRRLAESRELIFKLIHEHQGRVANTAGDAVLAEFGGVKDAVDAAVVIQQQMAQSNKATPEDKRMLFRIGINLSDVIERGGDLFGNGVNIAARLQSLADPGGICISKSVYEQIRRTPEIRLAYSGEQSVKNIAEPIAVYKVLVGTERPSGDGKTLGSASPTASHNYMVAVLPFDNLSEDPNQSYLGDGITEDLITGLATIESLRVPARNTMFTYKGKAVNIPQLVKDLGATHAVEGSVQKSSNRIRINVQLIDAANGNHIWANRYDKELMEMFAIQDEIVHAIVTEIDARLVHGGQARAWRRSTKNAEAFELFRQAQFFIQRAPTAANIEQSLSLLKRAQTLDPKFVAAYVWETHALINKAGLGSADPNALLQQAFECTEHALGLDDLSAEAHNAKGQLLFFARQDEQAEKEVKRSLDLDPTLPDTHFALGWLRFRAKKYEEALAQFRRGQQLSGNYIHPWGARSESFTLVGLGRLEEARSFAKINTERFVDFWAHLAAIDSALGHSEEAAWAKEELYRRIPDFKGDIGFVFLAALCADNTLIDWFQKNLAAAGIQSQFTSPF